MSDRNRHHEQHESVWLLLPWHANGTLEAAERRLVEDHLAGCADCIEELARCNGLAGALRDGQESAPSPHPIQLERLMERIEAVEARAALDASDPIDALDALDPLAPTHPINAIDEGAGDGEVPAAREPGAVRPAPSTARAGRAGGLPEARAAEATAARGALERPRGHRGGRGSLLAATPRPVRYALAGQLAAMLLLTAALAFAPARRGETGQPAPGAPAARPAAAYRTLSASSGNAEPAATAGTPARPRVRIVFVETATEKQIREVLLPTHGRLVDGPSEVGAYTLELPVAAAAAAGGGARAAAPAAGAVPAPAASPAEAAPDSLGIVLAYLHSRPIVRFAEPVSVPASSATSPP